MPHLMPGDSLNLQTAQDTDNGYSVFEQSLLRYIAAGLGVSYEQLSRNYAQMSYSTARASANESWAYFMGRRKFVASRQASQMFLCWLEEAIVRRVVTLPSKARFSFPGSPQCLGELRLDRLRSYGHRWSERSSGSGDADRSRTEYLRERVRKTPVTTIRKFLPSRSVKRWSARAAGLKPPAWAAAAFESGLRQSTEEEKSDSRAA
ncbi:phage portal protein (minor capsid protein) [Escherichia coli]|nr:phage portal protein (minor capsid protein) [Escherichia coli]